MCYRIVRAGALFALDPFCARQNDRVLLETPMMLWILLGDAKPQYVAVEPF